MAKAGNKQINKLNKSQNIKILIIWTIFIGILILFIRFFYNYIIKKLFTFIFSSLGYNINNSSDGNSEVDGQNGNENDLNNKFKLSMGIYYKNDIKNVLKKEFMDSLLNLSKITDLYLFIQVDSDNDEKHIMQAFEDNGIFESGLKRHKVLFCENLETIPSFARQLQSNMHIDTNDENILKLKDKVPNVASINLDSKDPLKEYVDNIEAILRFK
ncbi:hypothetical protein FG386_001401 [Cryptosporidium ryanae]|uniref:uncharacterized protein n=1 Tax=Cryptosporidium ryanae TaxID=515981 RepID=UPI00351A07B3|nr:hypothetical protein FG386_001401 [Cryptosporidium ryanae]